MAEPVIPPPPDYKNVPPPPDAPKGPELGPGNLPPGWAVPMPGLPPEPKGAAWSQPPMSTVMGLIGLGGGGALAPMLGAPALAGQMAGAGLVGAGEMPSNPLLGSIFGAALTGLTGAVGGVVGKTLGRRAGAFEWAQDKLKEAAEAVRDRVPQSLRFFEMPALSKTPMTFDEAIEKLSKARKADFQDGVKEFVAQLDRLELKAPVGRASSAGGAFASRAPEYLQDPGEFAQLAHSLAGDPTGRLLLGVPGLGVAAAGKGLGAHALKWLGEKLLP